MATIDDWKRVLDEAHAATAELIIRSQLEDIEQLAGDHGSDFAIARQAYEDELRGYSAIRQRERGEDAPKSPQAPVAGTDATQGAPAPPHPVTPEREADSEPPMKRRKLDTEAAIPLFSCVACGDDFGADDVYKNACDHYYCDTCLESIYRATLADDALCPPRCCHQVISHDDSKHYLPPELVLEFEGKREEPDNKDRVYCYEPTCSAYINVSDRVETTATCFRCERKTCMMCKGAVHEGDCSSDEALQGVLKLAGSKGGSGARHAGIWLSLRSAAIT